jgi:hypothetical protein
VDLASEAVDRRLLDRTSKLGGAAKLRSLLHIFRLKSKMFPFQASAGYQVRLEKMHVSVRKSIVIFHKIKSYFLLSAVF